eukprot:scaffold1.g5890.t1
MPQTGKAAKRGRGLSLTPAPARALVLLLLLLAPLLARAEETGRTDWSKQAFLASAPGYGYGGTVDELYEQEIGPRLKGQHYLDYTGSGLYWNSQVKAATHELEAAVYGNPHSVNPSAERSDRGVEAARAALLAHFGASADAYDLVFTRSGTGALHMVGESFPWGPRSQFAHSLVNHNSVLGIRSVARAAGAATGAVAEDEVEAWLADPSASSPLGGARSTEGLAPATAGGEAVASQRRLLEAREEGAELEAKQPALSLFAFPAYDNYAGQLFPLDWVARVHAKSTANRRWLVLLDAAAYAPCHPLNLTRTPADFVPLSFSRALIRPPLPCPSPPDKLFGYPSGVGALLVRRDAAALLRKQYWGGGATFLATAALDWVAWQPPPSKFEDGTLPFLAILGLHHGLDVFARLGGVEAIERHVHAVGGWLVDKLASLRHTNGAPLMRIMGRHFDPRAAEVQSPGTINFLVLKPSGAVFSYKLVSAELATAGFHTRACYAALGISDEEIRDLAEQKQGNFSDWEWIWVQRDADGPEARAQAAGDAAEAAAGRLPKPPPAAAPTRGKAWVRLPLGSLRFSLGAMSRFEDAAAVADFVARGYTDREDDSGPLPEPAFCREAVAEGSLLLHPRARAAVGTGHSIGEAATLHRAANSAERMWEQTEAALLRAAALQAAPAAAGPASGLPGLCELEAGSPVLVSALLSAVQGEAPTAASSDNPAVSFAQSLELSWAIRAGRPTTSLLPLQLGLAGLHVDAGNTVYSEQQRRGRQGLHDWSAPGGGAGAFHPMHAGVRAKVRAFSLPHPNSAANPAKHLRMIGIAATLSTLPWADFLAEGSFACSAKPDRPPLVGEQAFCGRAPHKANRQAQQIEILNAQLANLVTDMQLEARDDKEGEGSDCAAAAAVEEEEESPEVQAELAVLEVLQGQRRVAEHRAETPSQGGCPPSHPASRASSAGTGKRGRGSDEGEKEASRRAVGRPSWTLGERRDHASRRMALEVPGMTARWQEDSTASPLPMVQCVRPTRFNTAMRYKTKADAVVLVLELDVRNFAQKSCSCCASSWWLRWRAGAG